MKTLELRCPVCNKMMKDPTYCCHYFGNYIVYYDYFQENRTVVYSSNDKHNTDEEILSVDGWIDIERIEKLLVLK